VLTTVISQLYFRMIIDFESKLTLVPCPTFAELYLPPSPGLSGLSVSPISKSQIRLNAFGSPRHQSTVQLNQ
jgi:hypothetical protein